MKKSFYSFLTLMALTISTLARANVESDATELKEFLYDVVRYSDVSGSDTLTRTHCEKLKQTLAAHSDIVAMYMDKARFIPAVKKLGLSESDVTALEKPFQEFIRLRSLASGLRLPIPPELSLPESKLEALPSELLLDRYDLIPTETFLTVALHVNHILKSGISLKNTEAVRKLSDPREGIDLSDIPEKMRTPFKSIVENYFDSLPLIDKRRLILSFLELPIDSTWDQKLGAFLNSSGPAIQKLFQLIGSDTKNPQLRAILQALKSQIKPMSDEDLQIALHENFGDRFKIIFSRFDENPIAAASIGQVHRARLRATSEDIIVKIQRPNLTPIVEREFSALAKITRSEPVITNILKKIQESVTEELDFSLEAHALDMGQGYLHDRKGIYAVEKVKLGDNVGNKVLAMRTAPGVSLDHFEDTPEGLCMKSQALGWLLGVWIHRAVLSDGFYHGDLHAGNIFGSRSTSDPTKLNLTLIDFGNAGTLTPAERKDAFNLIVGGMFNSWAMIEEILLHYSPRLPHSEKQRLKEFYEGLKDRDLTYLQVLDLLGSEIVNSGVDLPKNLIMFNRGRMLLEKQIREANAALEQYPEISCSTMTPEEVYIAMGMRHYPTAWLKSVARLGDSPAAGPKTAYRVTRGYVIPQSTAVVRSTLGGTLPLNFQKIRYGMRLLMNAAGM